VDKLVHACIVDAARLSRAKLRVFGHNDLNAVERILRWADQRHTAAGFDGRRPTAVIGRRWDNVAGRVAGRRRGVLGAARR